MGYRNLTDRQGAFNVYEKPKKKEPISTVDEYQQAFLKSLEAYELSQRKPVRWNFLKDNEGMFQVRASQFQFLWRSHQSLRCNLFLLILI